MARTNIEKKEKDRLKLIFDAIDDDKDGEIELEEFVLNLGSKFDLDVKISEMEKIMKQVDLDYDGKVQFSEFLIAACNKRALFTQASILKCFNYIDFDQDGELTRKDLAEFLGCELDDYYIGNMIEDADDDCAGKLTFKNF